MRKVFLGRIYKHRSMDFKIPEMRSKCPKWKNVRRRFTPTKQAASYYAAATLRPRSCYHPLPHRHHSPLCLPPSGSSCLFPIIMLFNAIRMVIRLQFRNTSMTQLCECGGERRAGRLPVWHLEWQSGCHQIWGGGWVRTRASNLYEPSSCPAIEC